jgi:tubulin beta
LDNKAPLGAGNFSAPDIFLAKSGFGRLNNRASGGKYVPRVVLFDLKPGMIYASRASTLGEFYRPEYFVNQNAGAGNNWAKGNPLHKGWA